MNIDPNKRPVTITNAKTGATRMSKPLPQHTPRHRSEAAASIQTSQTEVNFGAPAISSAPFASVAPELQQVAKTKPQAVVMPGTESGADSGVVNPTPFGNANAVDEGGSRAQSQKKSGASKPKADSQTLEQFIEYVYRRKGSRVVLNSKEERLIAQNARLDDAVQARLLVLADGDTLLAVPRQLLLLSRDIAGFPELRAALASFVQKVIQRHPAFSDPGVRGALSNLPEALPNAAALAKVAAFSPADQDGKETIKGVELQTLRRNAAHLFAVWLAHHRGINSEELAGLLLQAMWLSAAKELTGDNARLRALTEIEQPAGVGVACQLFRQRAMDASASENQARREADALRVQLAESEEKRLSSTEQCHALEAQLEALCESTATEMAELRQQHEVERTHLRHDQEQLRGRLLHRIEEGVEMLDVGLTALRNKTPRVEVMVERAEHVIDVLRAEMNNLREK